jgi:fermentation-respiration switch protein FrsA (DUF1100 family)
MATTFLSARALGIVLGCLLLGYGAVIVWFRWNENRLIFAPDRGPSRPPERSLQLASRDVVIESQGLSLRARLIPPPASIAPEGAVWLLYLHGSSGSIGLPEYNEAWAEFHNVGLGVLAVDYRGFGESEGEISETGIYQDAAAAYRYLREEMGVPPSRILIYGFSLGAAVAIDLATKVEALGLMVEGAFLSIPRLGAERYPFLPVQLMAKNRFDSEGKIAEVSMPKLFLHARDDEAIPVSHSRRLFALAREPKTFKELGGTHGTSHKVDASFFEAVTVFLRAEGRPLLAPKPSL